MAAYRNDAALAAYPPLLAHILQSKEFWAEEPGFLASLPKRHAVRTMGDEKPRLTTEEHQTAKERFLVASLAVTRQRYDGNCQICSCAFKRVTSLLYYR